MSYRVRINNQVISVGTLEELKKRAVRWQRSKLKIEVAQADSQNFLPLDTFLTSFQSKNIFLWGLTDTLTGKKLKDFEKEDIVLCKGCKAFSYIQSFIDYKKCPVCHHKEFWRYGEAEFLAHIKKKRKWNV